MLDIRASWMASQLWSHSRTAKPASWSAPPNARATGLAPMIRNPDAVGAFTFSSLASGRENRLWTTTVLMITRNVTGTSSSAPGTSSVSRRIANSDATAAATIPRGESQASSAFSRQLSELPQVHSHTASGRATHTRTTRNAHASHDSRLS